MQSANVPSRGVGNRLCVVRNLCNLGASLYVSNRHLPLFSLMIRMTSTSRLLRLLSLAAGSLVAIVCNQITDAQPASTGAPSIFEPGVVSTGHEFTLTFSPDGKTAYFTRSFREIRRNHVMETHLVDGKWQEPKPVSFSSDDWSDLDPAVSPDGNRIYFVSTRPTPTATDSSGPDMDIWYAEWADDEWGKPVYIDAVNSNGKEGSPTVSADGTMCFFSDRNAEANVNSIYCSKMADGTFGDPLRLGPEINSGVSDTSPFLSPNGQTMLFYSTREGGYGEADLYVSFRNDGKWTPAQNLGPVVNTEEWEYNASVSRDGKTMFFGQSGNINAIPLEAVGIDGLTAERFVR